MSMTIGRAAESVGVGIQTLRFYEREGLIPCLTRTRSGYRVYDDDVLLRIRFIRRAQALGFTLREIRELMELQADEMTDCNGVMKVAQSKLEAVDEKIADLQRMRDKLQELMRSCRGGAIQECTVIECFRE